MLSDKEIISKWSRNNNFINFFPASNKKFKGKLESFLTGTNFYINEKLGIVSKVTKKNIKRLEFFKK